jgi:hypothetical protein
MVLRGEWIHDGYAAPGKAVLKVFRKKNATSGIRRRREDDGIPNV